ncbi:uncharacterized protein P174DRAFT_436754 [Aspergillus novofumigatus IBT 16806]|uniref:Uncharacterized protein n=1 Tax=Aspergillus novofumigatus (strain IBT 16806) TaxID=1392255 RepID=A0A2I1CL53_ASPN1|nr:uncharacterized protein P174DRAFT_436754 [Aspergillus novofumigatus IBT 16806]PKX98345.1 hypothetical protein P174DRAFT_436754 [Aspergillus novofumigatus IBT 16806]
MAYQPSRQNHQVRLSLNLPGERTDFNLGLESQKEFHITGNERGLQERYVQHVSIMLGPIFDS